MTLLQLLQKLIKFLCPYGLIWLNWKYSYLIDDFFCKFIRSKKVNNFGIEINSEDEECVILANAPSLNKYLSNKEYYDFIKRRIKFCVNRSCLSDYFFDLKPEFLCFMDPAYWEKKPSKKIKEWNDLTYDRLKNVNWKMKIILPKHAEKYNFIINLPKINHNISILYINTSLPKYVNYERSKKFNKLRFLEYKQNKASPVMLNVTIAPIYLSINIGFSKVFIFGMDHSWHSSFKVNQDNVPVIYYDNFYKSNKELIPMYTDGTFTSTYRVSELFEKYWKVHNVHEELNEYAKFMNVNLYNCGGSDSFVDAYKRLSI